MAEIVLAAESGRATGSSASRRLRAAHRIPAVLYGHGIEPISLSVDARELRTALNGEAGSRALLSLQVGGESHLAMARQLQRHPVRHTVTHIDFQVVRHDEVVAVEVPLNFLGEATEVNKIDGVVERELQTLAVRAIPSELPSSIDVDISGLTVGGAIRAADVALPSGVELDIDGETVVVIAHAGMAAAEAAAAAAAAPEAEEEGEAAAGDQPAEGS
ncbi:MAG: 50S ribosomal protein L25 [Acidimicrobiales bacterium]